MRFTALLMVWSLAGALGAQVPFAQWQSGADYDPDVPTYESFMGYAPGENLTQPRDAVAYLRALEKASGRVAVRSFGRTYQNREMVTVVVSSAKNMARLDAIIADNRQLTLGGAASSTSSIVAGNPVIVYLAYGVHGDEHSSTEAALLTAYHLAADRSAATRKTLDNVVAVIEPMQNPDGRMRYVNDWQNLRSFPANPDPNAIEHSLNWVSGRTNHYMFDLNRDWFALTQKETRARMAEYQVWHPQVMVDLHEMGYRSSYYFAPPADAINKNVTGNIRKWWNLFGDNNAAAFDAHGWLYFTRELFDAFYPGYGDSVPLFLGAVAMTYEQASAEGLNIRRPDGTLLTLADAARRHFTASVTTLATAADNRQKLLLDFAGHFRDGSRLGRASKERVYIFPADAKHRINFDLADIMVQLGIDVQQLQSSVTVKKSTDINGKPVSNRRFGKGTLLVRSDQPRHLLINTLLTRDIPMDAAYIKKELERQKAELSSTIYDVTAWSLPLAYNTAMYISAADIKAKTVAYDPAQTVGQSNIEPKAYAYLLPYESHHALQALAWLWSRDVQVHTIREPFEHSGRPFPRGTFAILPASNEQDLVPILIEMVAQFKVDMVSVTSGLTSSGIDLGSPNVALLKRPKVLVLYADRPVAPYSYGAIAWLMEEAYGLAFTPIAPTSLGHLRLSDYDVLILPDNRGSYSGVLNASAMTRVQAWVREGGTLIGLKGGAVFLTGESQELTSVVLADDVRPEEQDRKKMADRKEDGDAVPKEFRPKNIPGAIFQVDLNPHHYLTYGYGDKVHAQVRSSYLFLPSEEGHNVALFPEGGGLVSGFAWEGGGKQLSGKVYLVDEPLGRGHVILFADDPNVRGYWRGLSKLFMNSVMLSPSLRR